MDPLVSLLLAMGILAAGFVAILIAIIAGVVHETEEDRPRGGGMAEE